MFRSLVFNAQSTLRMGDPKVTGWRQDDIERKRSGDSDDVYRKSSGQTGIITVGWLVGWFLTSQQHADVSRRQICSDKFLCFHTEIEVADQTVYLIRSQYTDTGPTSSSADPITPGRLATGVPIFKSLV